MDLRPEYKRALLKYENGEFYVSCLSKFLFNLLTSCISDLNILFLKNLKTDFETTNTYVILLNLNNPWYFCICYYNSVGIW